ncbi:uncharacterized protein LOC106659292 isoform X1 [Trichogramma pretiosum]|nr:uncharacterized protein LOC106659292 isoform X1 [Trichogramma pretiosum]
MVLRDMPELSEPLPLQDLDGLLQQSLKDVTDVQVKSWKHLTDPGENFGSLILSIEASVKRESGEHETLHLVCKMPPKSEYLLDLFNSPLAFKKELYFYKTIAPAFLELQKKSGLGDNELIKLFPHLYGGRMNITNEGEKFDEQAAIVLENLNFSGYSTKDRITGMDLEHMQYGVRELAKLHAITCGYRAKYPKEFQETIAPGLEACHNEVAMNCVMEMIHKAINNLKRLEPDTKLIDRVLKTMELCERHEKEPKAVLEHWCTFVHADFWVNNMMYRYDNEKKITGMKIVDFQLSQNDYGMKDLVFFLISSAQEEVIDNNLNDLINLYYETFIDTLRALKVDTTLYQREEFDRLLIESAPLKFPQCIMMVQVIKATRGSAPDVNSITNGEAFLNIGKGQLYEKKLLHVLHTYDKMNWLA